MEGAAAVVAIDLGKFGTAFAWSSEGKPNPSVGNLDTQEPGEEVHRKSPNSLLALTEVGPDGNFKPWSGAACFGTTAETRYHMVDDIPVGSQLYRRFGLEQSWLFDVGPCESIQVKSSSAGSAMEVVRVLVSLLVHVRIVSVLLRRDLV